MATDRTNPIRNSGILVVLGQLLAAEIQPNTAVNGPAFGAVSQGTETWTGESFYKSLGESTLQQEATWLAPSTRLPGNQEDENDRAQFKGPIGVVGAPALPSVNQ